jgi:hypothetical protein
LNVAAFGLLGYSAMNLVPDTAEAAGWYNCRIEALFEIDGQMQVSCTNEYSPGVKWIAINTSDFSSDQENRFWSTASSALLSGRRFRVHMTDTECGFAGCRLASAWSLYTF